MTHETIMLMVAILLYSLATLGVFIGLLSGRRQVKMAGNGLALLGFLAHSLLAVFIVVTHNMNAITTSDYLLLLPWFLVLLYLAAWRILQFSFMAITAAPLALLLSIFSMRLANINFALPDNLSGLFITLHLSSLFSSLGLLSMAAVAGFIFLYVDGKMKKKSKAGSFSSELPALGACDKVNHVAVMAGFPLYTLGLIAGFVWAPMFLPIIESPKTLLSLFLWFFYALLFYQRLALGLRGKKPAKLALFLFLIAVIALGLDQFFNHHSNVLLSLA